MYSYLLKRFLIVGFATVLVGTAFLAFPSIVNAYPGPDNECPYGWDTSTNKCLERQNSGSGGGNFDAACQATAQFNYCQGSVYVGCNSFGSEYACKLLQLSYSNPNMFQQIMSAQKACSLDGNQQACNYLMQYKGNYF